MLGERQVAAPLMAQRAAHGALRLAHRRFQPGPGVGIQLAGLRLSGEPQRPSPGQFGHETLVLVFALIAPAASRPGQHRAVRRQRGRQVAPCGHMSTVGQRLSGCGARIDWILTSPDVVTKYAAVNAYCDQGRYPSHHLPVQAVITLPQPGQR